MLNRCTIFKKFLLSSLFWVKECQLINLHSFLTNVFKATHDAYRTVRNAPPQISQCSHSLNVNVLNFHWVLFSDPDLFHWGFWFRHRLQQTGWGAAPFTVPPATLVLGFQLQACACQSWSTRHTLHTSAQLPLCPSCSCSYLLGLAADFAHLPHTRGAGACPSSSFKMTSPFPLVLTPAHLVSFSPHGTFCLLTYSFPPLPEVKFYTVSICVTNI